MVGRYRVRGVVVRGAVAGALVVAFGGVACVEAASSEAAVSPHLSSVYSYSLTGASSTVANNAVGQTGAALRLSGDYSAGATGAAFTGDRNGSMAVGYVKPSSGYTLDVATNKAVGIGVRFVHELPAGTQCYGDSRNIAQVGRFAANAGQLKIQLTNCATDDGQVFVACRIAGQSSSTAVQPVRSKLPVRSGVAYSVTCVKSANAGGRATITLDVVEESTTTVGHDVFDVAATGVVRSSEYLSVANKYPLPPAAKNTDQLVGEVAAMAVCVAPTASVVGECLTGELGGPQEPTSSFASGVAESIPVTGLSPARRMPASTTAGSSSR